MDKSIGITFRPKYSRMCMECPPNAEDFCLIEFLCGVNEEEFLSIGHETGEGFWPYYDLTVEQTKMLHSWLGECLEKFSNKED